MKIAAVVLAAGASTRMGTPKQSLVIDGQTLLDRAITAVSALPTTGIIVVLGANAEKILAGSPGNWGECWVECDLSIPIDFDARNHPHPGPLPERRERGPDRACRLQVVVNHDWPDGMGGSIRAGVAAALADRPDLDGILITVCDQPRVDASVLSKLLNEFCPDVTAVAAGYADTVGVPAVFGRPTFDALLNLKSSGGAKPILSRPGVVVVRIPEAEIDVDTPDDFSKVAR